MSSLCDFRLYVDTLIRNQKARLVIGLFGFFGLELVALTGELLSISNVYIVSQIPGYVKSQLIWLYFGCLLDAVWDSCFRSAGCGMNESKVLAE